MTLHCTPLYLPMNAKFTCIKVRATYSVENVHSLSLRCPYVLAPCWAFSTRGLFPIVLFDGSLNTEGYLNILQERVTATVNVVHPEDPVLVHDNALCQVAQDTRYGCAQTAIQPFRGRLSALISTLWRLIGST